MTVQELMNKPLPQIPDNIRTELDHGNITITDFSDKNDLLVSSDLQWDAGYRKTPEGSYLVSMYCPMPGITPEMIEWWFWWHPQKNERYQVWFPGAHISTKYPKRQAAYFERESMPPFQDNTQCPVETIGGIKMPLRIDFVTPAEFGFSDDAMKKNDIPLIVCGHVGAFNGLVWHTEMAHIFKRTADGLFLISRFWMGKTLKNPVLRKAVLTDKTARGMAEHCCVEYRNLHEILPELYNKQ